MSIWNFGKGKNGKNKKRGMSVFIVLVLIMTAIIPILSMADDPNNQPVVEEPVAGDAGDTETETEPGDEGAPPAVDEEGGAQQQEEAPAEEPVKEGAAPAAAGSNADPEDPNNIYIGPDGDDIAGNGTKDNPFASLAKAFDVADDSAHVNVFLLGSIIETETAAVGGAKDITLKVAPESSGAKTITRASSFKGIMINVGPGNELTIADNITFDGANIEGSDALAANSGIFTLSGAAIKNNNSAKNGGGVFMSLTDAVFNIKSGEISGCKSEKFGDAMYFELGTMNISGTPKIGTGAANDIAGIYLGQDAVITVNGTLGSGSVINLENKTGKMVGTPIARQSTGTAMPINLAYFNWTTRAYQVALGTGGATDSYVLAVKERDFYVKSDGSNVRGLGDGSQEKPFASIEKVFLEVPRGTGVGNTNCFIMDSIDMPDTATLANGDNVEITIKPASGVSGITVVRQSSPKLMEGAFFTLGPGNTVTMENITWDGGGQVVYYPLLNIEGANVTFVSGKITNNNNAGGLGGGVSVARNGTFEIQSGEIIGNRAGDGSEVYYFNGTMRIGTGVIKIGVLGSNRGLSMGETATLTLLGDINTASNIYIETKGGQAQNINIAKKLTGAPVSQAEAQRLYYFPAEWEVITHKTDTTMYILNKIVKEEFYVADPNGRYEGSDTTGKGNRNAPYATIQKAVTESTNNVPVLIHVMDDLNLSAATTIATSKNITIQGWPGYEKGPDGAEDVPTLTRKFNNNNLFTMSGGSTSVFAALTFQNIIVDGNKASMPVAAHNTVNVGTYAQLTVSNGAILKNAKQTTASANGAAVSATTNSVVRMVGGRIEGNEAGQFGGGIYYGSANTTGNFLIFSGGVIEGNTSGKTGKEVYAAGITTMSGNPRIGTPNGQNGLFMANATNANYYINQTTNFTSGASVNLEYNPTAFSTLNMVRSMGNADDSEYYHYETHIYDVTKNPNTTGGINYFWLSREPAVYIASYGEDTNVGDFDNPVKTLSEAFRRSMTYVYVIDVVPVSTQGKVTAGKNLTLASSPGAVGAKLLRASNFTSEMMYIQGDTAANGGDAILNIEDIVVDGNKSTTNTGTLVYNYDPYAKVFLNDGGILMNNKAADGGAVQNIRSATFTMNGGEIKDNIAATNGGGVYNYTNQTSAAYNKPNFVMKGGSIENNVSQNGHGGGVFSNGILNFTGGTLKNNESTSGRGGGLYSTIFQLAETTNWTVSNAKFEGNKANSASGYGGGACFEWNNGSTGFSQDSSSTSYTRTINIKDCIFEGNTATGTNGMGGGLYVHSNHYSTAYRNTYLKVSDSTFEGNKATKNGGAFYGDAQQQSTTTGSHLYPEFTGCTMKDNESGQNGGGIYFQSYSACKLSVAGGTYTGNAASNLGGGIAVHNKETTNNYTITADISGAAFTDNSAKDGGGIHIGSVWTGNTVKFDLSSATLSGNSASNNGGGVWYSANTTATMKNSDIVENSADNLGNEIYANTHLNLSGHMAIGNETDKGLYFINEILHVNQSNQLADDSSISFEYNKLFYGGQNIVRVTPVGTKEFPEYYHYIGNYDVEVNPIVKPGYHYYRFNVNEVSYIASYGNDETGDGSFEKPWATLAKALKDTRVTVYVIDNVTTTETAILNAGKTLNLETSPGAATATITKGAGFSGNIIEVRGDNNTNNPNALTTKNLTFDGNNVASTGSAIFVLNSSSTLRLYDGTAIKNNRSSGNGGGVYNQGVMTVSGASITTSTASQGGGIYNIHSLTINNGEITGNSASNGGGIWNGSACTINAGLITNNSASLNGGGIYNSSSLTIRNNTLTGNNAGKLGKQIYSSTNVTISGRMIIGEPGDKPGGIYLSNNTYFIHQDGALTDDSYIKIEENKLFFGGQNIVRVNTGTVPNPGQYSKYEYEGRYTVKQNPEEIKYYWFIGPDDVYVATFGDDENEGTFEEPLFTLKEAFNYAGKNIYVIDNITTTETAVLPYGKNLCLSTSPGALMEGYSNPATVTRGAGFTGRFAELSGTSSQKSSLIMSDLIFDGNQGNVNNTTGSLVYILPWATFTMNDGAELTNNKTNTNTESGGVSMNTNIGGSTSCAGFVMNGGLIADNSAPQGAGVNINGYASNYCYFFMNGGRISNNIASSNGGGLFIDGSPMIQIKDGSIDNNKATNGGGMFINTVSNTVPYTAQITDTAIKSNIASVAGGGIYSNSNSNQLNLSGVSITSNSAVTQGGGIYANNIFRISGSSITENRANQGGGIYSLNANIITTGTAINNNTAANAGGGVYMGTNSASFTFFLTEGELNGNTSNGNGGGIYTLCNITASGSSISNNTMTVNGGRGAGVCAQRSSSYNQTATFQSCSIENNRATGTTGFGGGIHMYDTYGYSTKSYLNVFESLVAGNSAPNGGGIVVEPRNEAGWNNGITNIRNSTITRNSATNGNGGGIYHYYCGDLTVNSSEISKNTATGKGNAIFLFNNADVKLFVTGTPRIGLDPDDNGIFNDRPGGIINQTGNLGAGSRINIEGYNGGGTEGMNVVDKSGAVTTEAEAECYFYQPNVPMEVAKKENPDTRYYILKAYDILYVATSGGAFSGSNVTGKGTVDKPYETIEYAMSMTMGSSLVKIVLMDDPEPIAKTLTPPANRNIAITTWENYEQISSSPFVTLTRADGFNAATNYLFSFTNTNSNLTFENITLDGNRNGAGSTNRSSVLYVNNATATVTLGTASAIQNNTAENGGAIFINNGTAVLNGGVLRNCDATQNGGAVYISGGVGNTVTNANSIFKVHGGLITGCTAGINGGAVYQRSNTLMFMSGGLITGNEAAGQGITVNPTPGGIAFGSAIYQESMDNAANFNFGLHVTGTTRIGDNDHDNGIWLAGALLKSSVLIEADLLPGANIVIDGKDKGGVDGQILGYKLGGREVNKLEGSFLRWNTDEFRLVDGSSSGYVLFSTLNYYVSKKEGDDSFEGTIVRPFRTVEHAFEMVAAKNRATTIHVKDSVDMNGTAKVLNNYNCVLQRWVDAQGTVQITRRQGNSKNLFDVYPDEGTRHAELIIRGLQFSDNGVKNTANIFNIEGGTLSLSEDSQINGALGRYAVNIDGENVEFNMSGGTMNSNVNEAVVRVNQGLFNMFSASVENNTTNTSTSGAILVNSDNATFNMESGYIGRTLRGHGVYLKAGEFTITGAPQIEGYRTGTGVYLSKDKTMTLLGDLEAGSVVDISTKENYLAENPAVVAYKVGGTKVNDVEARRFFWMPRDKSVWASPTNPNDAYVLGDLATGMEWAEANGTPNRITSDILTFKFDETIDSIIGRNAGEIFTKINKNTPFDITFGAISEVDTGDPNVWGIYEVPIYGNWNEGDVITSIGAVINGVRLDPSYVTRTSTGGIIQLHRDNTVHLGWQVTADGVANFEDSTLLTLTVAAIDTEKLPPGTPDTWFSSNDITLGTGNAYDITYGAIVYDEEVSSPENNVYIYRLEIAGDWTEGDYVTVTPYKDNLTFRPEALNTVLHRMLTIRIAADNFKVRNDVANRLWANPGPPSLDEYIDLADARITLIADTTTGSVISATPDDSFAGQSGPVVDGTYKVTFIAENTDTNESDRVTVYMTVYSRDVIDVFDPDPSIPGSTGSALEASSFRMSKDAAEALIVSSEFDPQAISKDFVIKGRALTWVWDNDGYVITPTQNNITSTSPAFEAKSGTYPVTYRANGRTVNTFVTVYEGDDVDVLDPDPDVPGSTGSAIEAGNFRMSATDAAILIAKDSAEKNADFVELGRSRTWVWDNDGYVVEPTSAGITFSSDTFASESGTYPVTYNANGRSVTVYATVFEGDAGDVSDPDPNVPGSTGSAIEAGNFRISTTDAAIILAKKASDPEGFSAELVTNARSQTWVWNKDGYVISPTAAGITASSSKFDSKIGTYPVTCFANGREVTIYATVYNGYVVDIENPDPEDPYSTGSALQANNFRMTVTDAALLLEKTDAGRSIDFVTRGMAQTWTWNSDGYLISPTRGGIGANSPTFEAKDGTYPVTYTAHGRTVRTYATVYSGDRTDIVDPPDPEDPESTGAAIEASNFSISIVEAKALIAKTDPAYSGDLTGFASALTWVWNSDGYVIEPTTDAISASSSALRAEVGTYPVTFTANGRTVTVNALVYDSSKHLTWDVSANGVANIETSTELTITINGVAGGIPTEPPASWLSPEDIVLSPAGGGSFEITSGALSYEGNTGDDYVYKLTISGDWRQGDLVSVCPYSDLITFIPTALSTELHRQYAISLTAEDFTVNIDKATDLKGKGVLALDDYIDLGNAQISYIEEGTTGDIISATPEGDFVDAPVVSVGTYKVTYVAVNNDTGDETSVTVYMTVVSGDDFDVNDPDPDDPESTGSAIQASNFSLSVTDAAVLLDKTAADKNNDFVERGRAMTWVWDKDGYVISPTSNDINADSPTFEAKSGTYLVTYSANGRTANVYATVFEGDTGVVVDPDPDDPESTGSAIEASNFRMTLGEAAALLAKDEDGQNVDFVDRGKSKTWVFDKDGYVIEPTSDGITASSSAFRATDGTYPVTYKANGRTVTAYATVYSGDVIDVNDPDPDDPNSTGSALEASNFRIKIADAEILLAKNEEGQNEDFVDRGNALTWVWNELGYVFGGEPGTAGIIADSPEFKAEDGTYPVTYTANGRSVTIFATVYSGDDITVTDPDPDDPESTGAAIEASNFRIKVDAAEELLAKDLSEHSADFVILGQSKTWVFNKDGNVISPTDEGIEAQSSSFAAESGTYPVTYTANGVQVTIYATVYEGDTVDVIDIDPNVPGSTGAAIEASHFKMYVSEAAILLSKSALEASDDFVLLGKAQTWVWDEEGYVIEPTSSGIIADSPYFKAIPGSYPVKYDAHGVSVTVFVTVIDGDEDDVVNPDPDIPTSTGSAIKASNMTMKIFEAEALIALSDPAYSAEFVARAAALTWTWNASDYIIGPTSAAIIATSDTFSASPGEYPVTFTANGRTVTVIATVIDLDVFTVTFDKNGGDTEATPQTMSITELQSNLGRLPTPPSTFGKVFTGWNTNANGSGSNFTETTAVKEDITVYAQWVDAEYILSFDLNGAPGTVPASQQIKIGTKASTVRDPSFNGYSFKGWNTSLDGLGQYWDFATTVMPNGNVMLYAVWQKDDEPDMPEPPEPLPDKTTEPAIVDPDTTGPAVAPPDTDTFIPPGADTVIPNLPGGPANSVRRASEYYGSEPFGGPGREALAEPPATVADIINQILSGNVPLGGIASSDYWSLLSLILSFIALVISICLTLGIVIGIARKKRSGEEDMINDIENMDENEKSKAKFAGLLRYITIGAGVLTAIVWIILDDMSLAVAWINRWTPIVAVFFIIHLIAWVVYIVKKGSDKNKIDGSETVLNE